MTYAHYPQTFLARALADGHAVIAGEGRNERIHYLAADHSERWADPEEKVRAELWAELIYRYEYAPELIAFEVNVPRRTPDDFCRPSDLLRRRKEDALLRHRVQTGGSIRRRI